MCYYPIKSLIFVGYFYALLKALIELVQFIPTETSWLFLAGFLFGSFSLWSIFAKQKKELFYFFFFLSAVIFGLGFAIIDPYLNEWDEQYHGLVGMNLADNPLQPILIAKSPMPLSYKTWTFNHIWLHKQPLFLWQIALSIKCFGANVLAVRLPSVLLHAGTALLLVAISKRFLKVIFSILAGFLFAFSGYYNDFVSGAIGMDHNDVAFTFYVIASIWAWFKYRENSNKLKWILLIGLLVGAAVLTKWLVGLLVFSSWGLIILVENWKSVKDWKALILSFLIAILVFLPWQIFCYLKFPLEFNYEINYNSSHFWNCLEGHCGSWLFYWKNMKSYIGSGDVNSWFVLFGFILALRKAMLEKGNWLFLVFSFGFFFLFFTVAATKLEGYLLPMAPFGFIFLLYPVQLGLAFLRRRKEMFDRKIPRIIPILGITLVTFFYFNSKSIIDRHKYRVPGWRESRINSLLYIQQVVQENPDETYFVLSGAKTELIPNAIFNTGKAFLPYDKQILNFMKKQKTPFILIDLTRF